MPATKSEITNKNDFRGDILDRNFPVHFNAKTGAYSYDFADVTPAISSELEKIKYFRVSSPKLSEVEEEVVKHLKKNGPVAPGLEGEISKAVRKQAEEFKETSNIYESITAKEARGEALTSNETKAVGKAAANALRLARPKKAQNAKRVYNNIQRLLNEKGVNVNALRTKLAGPAPALTPEETEVQARLGDLDRVTEIIDVYEKLEALEEKEKSGKNLSFDEILDKQEYEEYLNAENLENLGAKSLELPSKMKQRVNTKGDYNAARAVITQIEGIPEKDRSAKQLKNLSNAKETVAQYEINNPNAYVKSIDTIIDKSRAIKEKYRNRYETAFAKVRNLSSKPSMTNEERTQYNNANRIMNAYSTLQSNTATNVEKKNAETLLKGAPVVNNTPTLEGFFENRPPATKSGGSQAATSQRGGKRRTKKAKKSTKKTHKRKH
jgi:hypothetical protein